MASLRDELVQKRVDERASHDARRSSELNAASRCRRNTSPPRFITVAISPANWVARRASADRKRAREPVQPLSPEPGRAAPLPARDGRETRAASPGLRRGGPCCRDRDLVAPGTATVLAVIVAKRLLF